MIHISILIAFSSIQLNWNYAKVMLQSLERNKNIWYRFNLGSLITGMYVILFLSWWMLALYK